MNTLTDDDIWAVAMTRNQSKNWFEAEIKFRDLCLQNEFAYIPPTTAKTDRIRRRGARNKMRRHKIDKQLFGTYTTASPPCSATVAPPTSTTSSDRPAVNEQPSKTAEEITADIKKCLNNKPPVFVVSGGYVSQKIEEGACCVFLDSNNGTRIEGNIASRPLLIVRPYNDMVATGIDCQYRFIHDNEHCSNNYVLYAFIGNLKKSGDTLELPNDVADVYSLHKKSIITLSNPHHGSKGDYYANGLKASYGTDESKSSVGYYKTNDDDDPSFVQFQTAQNETNSCIFQAYEYLDKELGKDDVIDLAANSSSVKLLNELYKKSPLSQSRPLETLRYGDNDLHWCSSNVCINACTTKYHTEHDTSMTLILRPYFQPCCESKCSQHRTTFNFKIPVNGSEELKIPLMDGCVILFSGYLLKHRQQNTDQERKSTSKGNCEVKFVNISCYSNGRFRSHMIQTAERVFKTTK